MNKKVRTKKQVKKPSRKAQKTITPKIKVGTIVSYKNNGRSYKGEVIDIVPKNELPLVDDSKISHRTEKDLASCPRTKSYKSVVIKSYDKKRRRYNYYFPNVTLDRMNIIPPKAKK